MPSFDIVSTFDIQEVDNAVNITAREVMTRYDLKDQKCIQKKPRVLLLHLSCS